MNMTKSSANQCTVTLQWPDNPVFSRAGVSAEAVTGDGASDRGFMHICDQYTHCSQWDWCSS